MEKSIITGIQALPIQGYYHYFFFRKDPRHPEKQMIRKYSRRLNSENALKYHSRFIAGIDYLMSKQVKDALEYVRGK